MELNTWSSKSTTIAVRSTFFSGEHGSSSNYNHVLEKPVEGIFSTMISLNSSSVAGVKWTMKTSFFWSVPLLLCYVKCSSLQQPTSCNCFCALCSLVFVQCHIKQESGLCDTKQTQSRSIQSQATLKANEFPIK